MSAGAINNKEAAALIGVSPNTLKYWRHVGRGPEFTKLGDSPQAGVRYEIADIDAWKAERKVASTSAYSPAGLANAKSNRSGSAGASA